MQLLVLLITPDSYSYESDFLVLTTRLAGFIFTPFKLRAIQPNFGINKLSMVSNLQCWSYTQPIMKKLIKMHRMKTASTLLCCTHPTLYKKINIISLLHACSQHVLEMIPGKRRLLHCSSKIMCNFFLLYTIGSPSLEI